jgi:hypothetical protein
MLSGVPLGFIQRPVNVAVYRRRNRVAQAELLNDIGINRHDCLQAIQEGPNLTQAI